MRAKTAGREFGFRLGPTSPLAMLRSRFTGPGSTGRARTGRDVALAAPGRKLDTTPVGHVIVRVPRWMRTVDFYRRALGVFRRERPALIHYNSMWIGLLERPASRHGSSTTRELWTDRNLRPEPRWWLLGCEVLFVRVAHAVVVASPGDTP